MEPISQITSYLVNILELLILVYFFYTVLYSLLFSVGAFFYRTRKKQGNEPTNIVVLIPAYKEDAVILETAINAVNHNYPSQYYKVVVIADSLMPETIARLGEVDHLLTIEVQFENSTKVKALNKALAEITMPFECAVILDADNIMETGFLQLVSDSYREGHKAVQGQRVAKNKNTSMAVLDGVSEAINNRIYRQGTTALGFSCSIIGSGVAVDFTLLKETLNEMKSIGGFDRDMEVRLIAKGIKVHYLKDAIVLDEKVDSSSVFKNQRKRWIYSQYHYLWTELKPGFKRLIKGDIVYFNSAVLRNIQLPRIINLGLLFLIMILTFLFPVILNYSFKVYAFLLGILILSNVLAIPRRLFNKDLMFAILYLPKVFIIMFSLLFKLKGSNKKFIHTPHDKLK